MTPLRQEPTIYRLVQQNYSFFTDGPIQVLNDWLKITKDYGSIPTRVQSPKET